MKGVTFPVTYYAHRGLHDANLPENSEAAMQAAKRGGFGAELDIMLDKDGNVVVFHDQTLVRMTGAEGFVWDAPEKLLRTLTLSGSSEKIPYFAELLPRISPMPLIVELKECPNWKLLCEKTAALLQGYGGHAAIESFDPRIVLWFKRHAPDRARGLLQARHSKKSVPNLLKRMVLNGPLPLWLTKPHFLSIPEDFCDQPHARRWIAKGNPLSIWTIRSNKHRAAHVVTFEGFLPTPENENKTYET